MTWAPNRRSFNTMLATVAGTSFLGVRPGFAETIKVAGIYTQPIQQKWDARLHQGLEAAKAKGEIEYVFSEKVANTDYIRVLREYCESGVKLIVGEAFGISKEARKVADEYPEIAFLMGDPFEPHGSNFAVFDNYIHEPCYLMGILAGSMTKTNKLGMVGGYPIGEVNRLFHAFIAGAKSVNPNIEYKVTFIGSWYDPPKAKEAAFAQIEAGADIMYAERAGVVDAAREKGVMAFGNVNDMNKEENGTDVVVTSALWHMEAAIANAIAEVKSGTFKAANYKEWTMMRKGGASLAPYYEFDSKIPAAAKAKVEEVKANILSGAFDVEINDTEPKSSF
ncbi:MAG: BMP family ABC transporter substrate-binding protein [Rhizobiaceae bacterium]|nr:BMP family ABC transporter substrate-binding protein [Rhizobiaceae bacterium]